jgi:ribonuclease HI
LEKVNTKRKLPKTFFAVVRGHHPGIYRNRQQFDRQFKGFPNPKGKAFRSEEGALNYLRTNGILQIENTEIPDLTIYYVVKRGKKPGIYLTSKEFEAQVKGFKHPIGKKVVGRKLAERWFNESIVEEETAPIKLFIRKIRSICKKKILSAYKKRYKHDIVGKMPSRLEVPYAYIDGSYNFRTYKYGYGLLFSVNGNEVKEYYDAGNDEELVPLQNIAGEYLGAIKALVLAMEYGLNELHIYHDLDQIGHVALGISKAKNKAAIRFKNVYDFSSSKMTITFHNVKSHSGVVLNERADKLAKYAVGVTNKI